MMGSLGSAHRDIKSQIGIQTEAAVRNAQPGTGKGKNVNKQYISSILAITSLAFSDGAMAQNMSKSEYKAADKAIESEYNAAKVGCDPFAGNARDICMSVVKGHEKVA